jgi:F-type H+-transporting ATPase subunit epsilon
MADKLKFNLVSPERELVARDVDEVIVPGTEGEFGVFANHSPFMSTLMPGVLVVKDAGAEEKIFVQGGFADVTPEGLTVLAELAIPTEELKGDLLANQKKAASDALEAAETAEETLAASRAVEVLAAL